MVGCSFTSKALDCTQMYFCDPSLPLPPPLALLLRRRHSFRCCHLVVICREDIHAAVYRQDRDRDATGQMQVETDEIRSFKVVDMNKTPTGGIFEGRCAP